MRVTAEGLKALYPKGKTDWLVVELCPECLHQLEHIITAGRANVFGCPHCKKEVSWKESIHDYDV